MSSEPDIPKVRDGQARIRRQVAQRKEQLQLKEDLITAILEKIELPGSLRPDLGLSPEELEVRYKEFFQMILNGATLSDSILMSGIPTEAFQSWMRKGGDPNYNKGEDKRATAREPFRAFALMVRAAQAKSKYDLVELIRLGALKDWKAAAWLLERRFPKEFNKPATTTFGISTGDPSDERGEQTRVVIYIPRNGREAEEPEIGPGPYDEATDRPVPAIDEAAIEAGFEGVSIYIPSNGRESGGDQ